MRDCDFIDACTQEELLVRACKRIVKGAYKVKMGTASEHDRLLMLDGEVTLRKVFPSLDERDVSQLANYIVDIASWSLRHLLGMKLPDSVAQKKKTNIRDLVEAPWESSVFDDHNKAYALFTVAREITHRKPLTAVEIYRVLVSRRLEFRTHETDPVWALEKALVKAPTIKHFKTLEGVKFRPIYKKTHYLRPVGKPIPGKKRRPLV